MLAGCVLNAVSGSDVRIPPNQLSFSIYSSEVARRRRARPCHGRRASPTPSYGLNAGTYHVVSEYGNVNADHPRRYPGGGRQADRSDDPAPGGTDQLQARSRNRRRSDRRYRLVDPDGSRATASAKASSAFSAMVLAEGEYTAVARNKDKIYQRDFTVGGRPSIPMSKC